MPTFAILDTNAGLLQWIGEASEEGEAYDLYAEDVGEDPFDLLESSKICELSAEEAKQVRKWHGEGSKTVDTPDCLLFTR